MSEGKTEYQLKSPPEDGISAVEFCPTSTNMLLVSSWDRTIRLYEVGKNEQRLAVSSAMPVLDCAWQDQARVLAGGLDKCVKLIDVNSSQERVLGQHEAAVKCVDHSPEFNVTISGSWDGTVKTWDPRTEVACTGTHAQTDKVYSMSSSWVGGPANTTHSWGLLLMLEMQEEEERSQEGAMMEAVQLTFSFTWNIRAREGQGSEEPGQEPQSYKYFLLVK